jgi:hypothetical protein
MQDLNRILKEAKEHLEQFKKGKYTAEPMCHALADSLEELVRYIEDYIEDDMR